MSVLFRYIYCERVGSLWCGAEMGLGREDRTKDRPIARGDITRQEAFWFLGLQLSGGLAVLTQLNWYRCVRVVC